MPIILSVTPNLEENPWSDLPDGTKLVTIERVGALPKGTNHGNPAFVVQGTVDGKPVLFQTSLRNMIIAVKAFEALHGPFDMNDMSAIVTPGIPPS